MGRNRQPIDLIVAKGRKHLSKAEIERRREEEIKVPFTDVRPPSYLTGKAADEFDDIAEKLLALNIFTELDADCLARYIMSKALYLQYTSELNRMIRERMDADVIGKFQRLQDSAFKQCRACASDLGLTITSRCKLQVPKVEDEEDYEL